MRSCSSKSMVWGNTTTPEKATQAPPYMIRCKKFLTHSTCDQAYVEYPDLLKTAANVSTPEFDRDQYRLDEYLFDISRFPAIAEVSHFILTLRQADMERGFSVYKKVGQVNITKMSIVSAFWRITWGPRALFHTRFLSLTSKWKASKAHPQLTLLYLEDEKKKNHIQHSQSALSDLASELSSRKRRYSKLEEESQHLDAKLSTLVDKAERKNEMKYVMEENILKWAAAKKQDEMNLINSEIQELELKRQKVA